MTEQTAALIAGARAGLQLRMASVPTPPDASAVGDWSDDGNGAFRTFTGSTWRVPFAGDVDLFGTGPDISVEIHGRQFADGTCTRWVVRGDIPEDIPAATLRLLVESFSGAHAEIERLASTPVFSAAATPSTPDERSRAAAKASYTSWGNTADRTARTAPGRRAFEQRFLDQANGDPKRAAALRKAYFMDLTQKSIKARKRRQGR